MTHALHTAFFRDVQTIADQTELFDTVRTWPVVSTLTGLTEMALNTAWAIASLPVVLVLQAASYAPFIPRSIHDRIVVLAGDSVTLLQKLLSNIARAFTSAFPFARSHITWQVQYSGSASREGFSRSSAIRSDLQQLNEGLAAAEETRRRSAATILDLQQQLDELRPNKEKFEAAQAHITELNEALARKETAIADLREAHAAAQKENETLQHTHVEDQATSEALSKQIEEIQRSLQAAKERYDLLERDTTPVREKAGLAERAAKAVEELRGNLQALQTRYDELDAASKQEIATRQKLLENEQLGHVATKALREQDTAALESAKKRAAEMEQRYTELLAKIQLTPEKKGAPSEKPRHRRTHSSSASLDTAMDVKPPVPVAVVERIATPPSGGPLDAAAAPVGQEPTAQ